MKILYFKTFLELPRKVNELGIKQKQIVGLYKTDESIVLVYYE